MVHVLYRCPTVFYNMYVFTMLFGVFTAVGGPGGRGSRLCMRGEDVCCIYGFDFFLSAVQLPCVFTAL
jgi:hypothetical protein